MTKAIYKSRSRWENATEAQKSVSAFQRKINNNKKYIGKLLKKLSIRKQQARLDYKQINDLKNKVRQLKKILFEGLLI